MGWRMCCSMPGDTRQSAVADLLRSGSTHVHRVSASTAGNIATRLMAACVARPERGCCALAGGATDCFASTRCLVVVGARSRLRVLAEPSSCQGDAPLRRARARARARAMRRLAENVVARSRWTVSARSR